MYDNYYMGKAGIEKKEGHGSRVEDIHLPEDWPKFKEVVKSLNEAGLLRFNLELIDALDQARNVGDAAPINDVLEAWHRSLLFHRNEGFGERWDRDRTDEPRYSLKQIRERLGL